MTEALAEHRASLFTDGQPEPGGECLGHTIANLGGVERLLALAAYIAQPDADLVTAAGGHRRPVRAGRPAIERQVWRVGATS